MKIRKLQTCSMCGQTSHNRASCGRPSRVTYKGGPRKCSNCGALGHNKKTCNQPTTEKPDLRPYRCNNCWELGHNTRTCVNPAQEKPPVEKVKKGRGPPPNKGKFKQHHPDFEAQLGKVSDPDLARKYGLSRSRVQQIRVSRGIPKAPDGLRQGHLKRCEGKTAKVGAILREHPAISNREISRRLGCTDATVARIRDRLGLAKPLQENCRSVILRLLQNGPKTVKDVAEALKSAGFSTTNVPHTVRRCRPGVVRVSYGVYALAPQGE